MPNAYRQPLLNQFRPVILGVLRLLGSCNRFVFGFGMDFPWILDGFAPMQDAPRTPPGKREVRPRPHFRPNYRIQDDIKRTQKRGQWQLRWPFNKKDARRQKADPQIVLALQPTIQANPKRKAKACQVVQGFLRCCPGFAGLPRDLPRVCSWFALVLPGLASGFLRCCPKFAQGFA